MLKRILFLVIALLFVAWVFHFTVLDRKRFATNRIETTHTQDKFFEDKFDTWEEGKTYGFWHLNFNGGGRVGLERDDAKESQIALFQKPKSSTGDKDPSTKDKDTHASLVTSTAEMVDFTWFLKMKTIEQLRTPVPNHWETAWVLWHYTDNDHFYYFVLRINGWELGKRDPTGNGGQRFLKAGDSPKVSFGNYDGIRVQQVGATMTVNVNGVEVVNYTDEKNPYLKGKIGLYNEDAYVHFDDVSVTYK